MILYYVITIYLDALWNLLDLEHIKGPDNGT